MTEMERKSGFVSSGVPTEADIQRMLAAELPLPGRIGFVLLFLVGVGSAGVAGSLALTEPAIPVRTRLAFAVMVAIGVTWAGFAAWVLARRRVLFGRHRVIAARLAVAFTGLFVLGAAAVTGLREDSPIGRSAVLVGLLMLAAAIWQLLRARRYVTTLTHRRREIEQRLGMRAEDVR